MDITIVYCSVWNYEPRAVGLVSLLMDRYKRKVGKFLLVPSDGGKFEVTVGDRRVWSKKESGEFPDDLALANVIDGIVLKKAPL